MISDAFYQATLRKKTSIPNVGPNTISHNDTQACFCFFTAKSHNQNTRSESLFSTGNNSPKGYERSRYVNLQSFIKFTQQWKLHIKCMSFITFMRLVKSYFATIKRYNFLKEGLTDHS